MRQLTFRLGQTSVPIFAVILPSLGEPSLFEAAKDASVYSIRVSYLSPVPAREIAVRLVVNADGKGQIISVVSSGTDTGAKRTESSVSNAEVSKFLQLVERDGFWSMSSADPETHQAGRQAYILDGAYWMVEGVRSGTFHFVYGVNPRQNPLIETVGYLTKDLAKLDDSVIRLREYTSPRQRD